MVEFYVLRLLNKLLDLYIFMGYTKQQLTGIIRPGDDFALNI